MKRLSGGQVLLNLTAISLGLTSGEVSITDAGILGELTELRNFIDVNRDFSKGFKNLKPVLIEYRSSASKFNGIALANLSFNTDALHMSIGANTIQDDGKMLVITINVVYEWVDYIGYQVKTAKLNAYETLATGDGTFTGDVGVGGDLSVTGDAILPEINGEENPSVKPLYWHGVELYKFVEGTGYTINILMVIINNSSTQFTLETLKSTISNFGDNALINLSGFFKDGETQINNVYGLYRGSNNYYEVIGTIPDGFGRVVKQYTSIDDLFDLFNGITDRCNKLN